MMVSDLAAGLTTAAILILYSTGGLQVWHLYVTAAIAGCAGTFQYLAYSASITTMLPKEQYARASGMISLADYTSKIGAPILAGVLLGVIGIGGILIIDIITFLIGVGTLLAVHIPQPAAQPKDGEREGNLWRESLDGFRYIFRRAPLVGLLGITFAFATAESLGYPLIAPMILARTGNNELILGSVQAVMGIGGVLGGILLTIWGGPKRKIHAILIGLALTGLLGDMLMGLGRGLPMWLIAGFFLEVFIPTLIGSNNAIWQSKVAPEIQGRVFAARGILSSVAEPASMILAGVLVDRVFEPAMMPNGSLASAFGGIVGVGPGAGMGLVIVICGIGSALAGLAGYTIEPVRRVEDLLPDHDTVTVSTP
jgi:MFS family permease